MKIEYLKQIIESNSYNGESFIFTDIDNCSFIVHQYLNDLISKNGFTLVNVNSTSEIPVNKNNFLSVLDDGYFYVYYTDKPDDLRSIVNFKNCSIVYTGKKLKDILDIEDYIISVPKVEKWQIKDYVYSRAKGVDSKDLDYLLDITEYDLWRLEKELDKIEIFDEKYRKEIFKQFIKSGIFNDLIPFNTFNLIDAVVKRQPAKALEIYEKLKELNTNNMGIISLLYNNFRNIIKIQLSPNPTPESTGLKSNQFWAIKKNNVGYYYKEELLYIFGLLTDIDKKIKTGEISVDMSLDYLFTNIFKL